MKITHLMLLGLSGLLLIASPVQAAFFQENEHQLISQPINDDAYVAGERVTLKAPVNGELFAAGSIIDITQPISRSAVIAGRTLNIEGKIGHNGWIAGENVTISGEIGHDLFVAGSSVVIEEGTVINGDLFVGAEKVELNGTVNGRVLAGAERMTLNATVGKELRIYGENIEFTGGSVGQNLVYGSDKEPAGLDKVHVSGKTEKVDPKSHTYKWGGELSGAAVAGFTTGWLFNLLSSLLLGAVLIRFLPKKLIGVTDLMTKEWNRSFITGLLTLIVTPILAMILMFTLFGMKLGFIIMATYAVLLAFVSTYGLFIVGRWILSKTGDAAPNWWARLLVGAAAVAIIMLLPVIGWILMAVYFFALTLPALGATLLWYREQVR